MDRRGHWERVHTTKAAAEVSWFEPTPELSLRLLDHAGLTTEMCVIDVGGGEGRLVDALIDRGLACLAVLDISESALARAKVRLGTAAATVTWIAADVTGDWSSPAMDVWHDRAVFHFLTFAADRAAYRTRLDRTVKPGGSVIIATFALDGPETCSGLPVARYSPDTLAAELGATYELVESLAPVHRTPSGAEQRFQYSRFVRIG